MSTKIKFFIGFSVDTSCVKCDLGGTVLSRWNFETDEWTNTAPSCTFFLALPKLVIRFFLNILMQWSSTIYGTIILHFVLYGCETWSLTLREERKLRVFENWVLRRIFGPKRDEVTGEWRKLHNEELNNLYSSINIVWVIKSRRMRWAGHVARMGEGRGVYTFGGETWGKETTGETQA